MEPKRRVEWVGVIVGSILLLVVAAGAIALWNYYNLKPAILPYPWAEFKPSWIETPALAILAIGLLFMAIIGLVLLIGMGFEEFFARYPRFPLPEELRGRSYRFPRPLALAAALEEDLSEDRATPKPAAKSEQNAALNGNSAALHPRQ